MSACRVCGVSIPAPYLCEAHDILWTMSPEQVRYHAAPDARKADVALTDFIDRVRAELQNGRPH